MRSCHQRGSCARPAGEVAFITGGASGIGLGKDFDGRHGPDLTAQMMAQMMAQGEKPVSE